MRGSLSFFKNNGIIILMHLKRRVTFCLFKSFKYKQQPVFKYLRLSNFLEHPEFFLFSKLRVILARPLISIFYFNLIENIFLLKRINGFWQSVINVSLICGPWSFFFFWLLLTKTISCSCPNKLMSLFFFCKKSVVFIKILIITIFQYWLSLQNQSWPREFNQIANKFIEN